MSIKSDSDFDEEYIQLCDIEYHKKPDSIEDELYLLYDLYNNLNDDYEDYYKKIKNSPFFEIINFLETIEFTYKLDRIDKENIILCDTKYINDIIDKIRYKLEKSHGDIVKIDNVLAHFDMLVDNIKEKYNVDEKTYNKYNDFINKINNIIKNLNSFNNDYEIFKNNIEELKIGKNKENGNINNINNIDVKFQNNIDYPIGNILQTKINIFKNKFKNNKLKKDLSFKLNGKEYNFSSINNNISPIISKKEEKKYSKTNYFNKYKRITDDDINKIKENNEKKIKEKNKFWLDYNNSKNKSKLKINNIFKDEPLVNIDKNKLKEEYNNNVQFIYKKIINDLNLLEKEYNNIKIVENYYNRLKENKNIMDSFGKNNGKINMLFSEYEKQKTNEYSLLCQIGKIICNNELSKEEAKQINSINDNSRPARLLRQCKRIYLLEDLVELKDIMLAGISNWLRDTSDENFELLLTFFTPNT